jgi:anti-sigma factor RsiW
VNPKGPDMTNAASRCEGFSPLIDMSLDGELTEREAERVARHLASCARCARISRRRSALRNRMPRIRVPAPAALRGVIVESLEDRPVAPVVLLRPQGELVTS